jgi:DNA-binding MarR family transcriptional regulator
MTTWSEKMQAEDLQDRIERMRAHARQDIRQMLGQDQITGVEISHLVRMVSNQYEMLGEQLANGDGLSGPRLWLLLRLMAEEDRGNREITPTDLSRCQNVSKNTISALLRGLEDQGLITRQLDPNDRRIFRIQITSQGRALILATAPHHGRLLNQVASQLTPEEQEQLINLLGKLYRSIVMETHPLEVA